MIPAWKVRAIEALLAEGRMSQRQIAQCLQVWRGTVAGIADGTRPAGGDAGPDDPLRTAAPPQRCPGCGGLVTMPCLACYTRARQPRRPRPAPCPYENNARIELGLLGPHRVRYEQLRARMGSPSP